MRQSEKREWEEEKWRRRRRRERYRNGSWVCLCSLVIRVSATWNIDFTYTFLLLLLWLLLFVCMHLSRYVTYNSSSVCLYIFKLNLCLVRLLMSHTIYIHHTCNVQCACIHSCTSSLSSYALQYVLLCQAQHIFISVNDAEWKSGIKRPANTLNSLKHTVMYESELGTALINDLLNVWQLWHTHTLYSHTQ